MMNQHADATSARPRSSTPAARAIILRLSSSRRGRRPRRGTILVTAIWACIAMTGIILVMARTTKVELTSSGNRVSAVQAAAIERGAEQYILSLVEAAAGDPSTAVEAPAESMILGGGYFWLIKPYPDDEKQMAFGLVDEASKLGINDAGDDEILKLPGMTQDFADSIVDWRDTDTNVTNQGAEDDYYMSLPQPYHAKNDRLESIEELKLVKGYTDEIMWGLDANHNSVLDDFEQTGDTPAAGFNSANGAGRGIAPFITVYSAEAIAGGGTTGGTGGATGGGTGGGGGAANVNSTDTSQVQQVLSQALDPSRADGIVGQMRSGRPFSSVFDFAAKTGMTADELKKVYSKLSAPAANSTAKVAKGKVNINTAPREVLACLPGLEQADVDKLIDARATAIGSGTSGLSSDSSLGSTDSSTTTTDVSWVYEAIGPAKAAQVGSRITNKSYQYSADIVAITSDGRSFKRVRIVVDGQGTAAKIVYRKDLTDLGWPLSEDIRTSLKQGQQLEQPYGTGAGSTPGGF